MVLFYAKQFTLKKTGARLVGVKCDHCGCDYYFQLTRVGRGDSVALYGLGEESLASEAVKQAHTDLQEKLQSEAEMVPCPNCHWVNAELIRGWCRGHYAGCGCLALLAGGVGTTISLIIAWFLSRGPAADQVALPYFLYWVPGFFLVLTVTLKGLQLWRQSRVNPNRTFPDWPSVPFETPPALLADRVTGELHAVRSPGKEAGDDGWYDFQVGFSQFLPQCVDCLEDVWPEDVSQLEISDNVKLDVPRCSECTRRAKLRARRKASIVFVVLMGIGLACISWWSPGAIGVTFLLLLFALISLFIAWCERNSQLDPAYHKQIDKDRGHFRLKFRNPDYRPQFKLPDEVWGVLPPESETPPAIGETAG